MQAFYARYGRYRRSGGAFVWARSGTYGRRTGIDGIGVNTASGLGGALLVISRCLVAQGAGNLHCRNETPLDVCVPHYRWAGPGEVPGYCVPACTARGLPACCSPAPLPRPALWHSTGKGKVRHGTMECTAWYHHVWVALEHVPVTLSQIPGHARKSVLASP